MNSLRIKSVLSLINTEKMIRTANQLKFGIVLILFSLVASAQNNISVQPANSIVLNFSAPIDAGSPIEPVVDNSKWLNYNITVASPDLPYSITAEIESGIISEGLQLQLQAGVYTGTGGGSPGISAESITLGSISKVLVSNIGTCNTGIGSNVGHQLTYTMSIADYSLLKSSSSTINILFTIKQ